MAKAGRKMKSGKRTKTGRLSRAGISPIDRGTERTQAMRARFGDHYQTALGRAYAVGLLGEGQEGKDRLEVAKRFARLVRRYFEAVPYRCALDTSPRGNPDIALVDLDLIEREQSEFRWLCDKARELDHAGVRPYLDQMIADRFIDHDPPWLSRLLNGGRHFGDVAVMNAALLAMDVLVGRKGS
ncbi:MAG: hypothetical protein KG075_17265 [Alphaproteobacteria bacterium]|nr:hypothetical protein [Alphaproteobacteria bacterium]